MLFEGHSGLRVIGEIQARELMLLSIPVLCFDLKHGNSFYSDRCTDVKAQYLALKRIT